LNVVLDSSSPWLWESAFFADFHSHHQRQPPLKEMSPRFCLQFLISPSALWELWKSQSVLCGGFSKQLVEIIQKKSPKATFVDFHSCGSFHSAFRPAFFFRRDQEVGSKTAIPCIGRTADRRL
jgi:hypothetical protein